MKQGFNDVNTNIMYYIHLKSRQMCIYRKHGNPFSHVILLGSKTSNYQSEYIFTILADALKHKVPHYYLLLFSHYKIIMLSTKPY